MYSGLFCKRRSVSGAKVYPAQSRLVLAPSARANCTGCKHCAVMVGYGKPDPAVSRVYACMAKDPPAPLGTWMTVRPDWCPVAERDDEWNPQPSDADRARIEGLGAGEGREPEESRAAADALQIAGLVLFMCFIAWCLTSCADLGKLVR